MKRVMIKTTYHEIVVALNPATSNDTVQTFLLYASNGGYDSVPFSDVITVGTNGLIFFKAMDSEGLEYSVDGFVQSGQAVIEAIQAAENPPVGVEPDIAIILQVDYMVQT